MWCSYTMPTALSKAQACLLCQIVGDSLGSLVEFESEETIRQQNPIERVRHLKDGGTFETLAGQPTDDSELALILARTLVDRGFYSSVIMRGMYRYWLDSKPFDLGKTTQQGIIGKHIFSSQANGALMRVSPIGIFGANKDPGQVMIWAMEDALLTHPNPICLHVNALYAWMISHAIKEYTTPDQLYAGLVGLAVDMGTHPVILEAIDRAGTAPPEDYMENMGWVIIAFQNALYQLLHASSLEEGIVDTVNRGGDTDTNGAIAGALLGALYGLEKVPQDWKDTVRDCWPSPENPKAKNPRPPCFWPNDYMALAERLQST